MIIRIQGMGNAGSPSYDADGYWLCPEGPWASLWRNVMSLRNSLGEWGEVAPQEELQTLHPPKQCRIKLLYFKYIRVPYKVSY